MRGRRKEVVRLYRGLKRFHGAEVTRSTETRVSHGVFHAICVQWWCRLFHGPQEFSKDCYIHRMLAMSELSL